MLEALNRPMPLESHDMEFRSRLPFARLDPVTYLPNRQQFLIDYGRPQPDRAQLVMVTLADAGHFNALLRALGHDYSEDFIRAGAARIRACVPEVIEVYHVSVLSFVFISPANTEALVSEIHASCARPLVVGGLPIVTRPGIGIADCASPHGQDPLRNALAAAQDSRNSNTIWARYDSKKDDAHRRSFMLLTDLTAALASPDQLQLHYQPKFDLATGRATSAEALLRWNHPKLGPVSPAEFVPLAENTALIDGLTDWVLRHAAAQAADWHARGMRLNMAINVSPLNLSERGFGDRVATILEEYDIPAAAIELEFTEGRLASNNAVVLSELKGLRNAGVHIALDDFGTGFSNLSYITHLPADIIKLDKSFIRRITVDERSAVLVRSLIQLAHRLNYMVVGEGIESAEAYRLLAAWGCDEGQGFFMSKPLDENNFGELMRSRPPPQRVVR
jgi:EAL domain-containing protein (putative c-di-GMP-specific phosphodiesterase class I)/GGDEF domain-containing protein